MNNNQNHSIPLNIISNFNNNIRQLSHSRKGISNSLVNRLNGTNMNRSGVKEKSLNKMASSNTQNVLSNSKQYNKNYFFTPNKY